MNKLKDILKSSLISMMMSFTIFVIVGMIFDLTGGGTFHMENHGFTKMAFACMITGLGFGVPSVLYSMEQLPMPLATVLHLGTGFAIYFIAATYVGWIPTGTASREEKDGSSKSTHNEDLNGNLTIAPTIGVVWTF